MSAPMPNTVAAQVVVVHRDECLRGLLATVVRDALDADVQVGLHGALDGAVRAQLDSGCCRLVVLDASAGPVAGAPDYGHVGVKQLLRGLAMRSVPPGIAVVVTREDEELRRMVESLPGARLVGTGPADAWETAIEEGTRQAFGQREKAGERRTRSIFKIKLSSASEGSWSVERRGPAAGISDPRTLALQSMEMNDIRSLTDLVKANDEAEGWVPGLAAVANLLYREVFHCDPQLRSSFEAEVERHGADAIRIVFELTADLYHLPVEALRKSGRANDIEQWYALRAALIRQYEGEGPREPLFWDTASRRRPVDCLVVAADGRAGPSGEALPQIEHEAGEICRILTEQKKAGANIGVVEPLMLGTQDDPRASLCAMLKDRPWTLVHFAGHSGIAETQETASAYWLLSAMQDARLAFGELARLMPEVQFLYMSSCRSANPLFLHNAIRESIPAVLGYRWRVRDSSAQKLALAFYTALFTPGGTAYRSLGRALAHARRQIFGQPDAGGTWVSSMLLTKGSRQRESAVDSYGILGSSIGSQP